MAMAALPLAELGIGEATAIGASALPAIKSVLPKIEQFGAKIAAQGGRLLGKQGAKELVKDVAQKTTKQKIKDAVIYQGLLPGAGFTIAGALIPSSKKDENGVSEKDLANAHKKANGNLKKLKNHKLPNGQKFVDARAEWVKKNKNKLLKAHNNPKLLYKQHTDLHRKALYYNISLDNKRIKNKK